MSVRQSFHDGLFLAKIYLGAFVFGGCVGGVLYPLYLFNFPDANLIQVTKIVIHVFQRAPAYFWLAVGCGAVFSWTIVWMLLSRPWRGDGEPSTSDDSGSVEKPW